MNRRVHIIIKGKVQGVFFRAVIEEKAKNLKVKEIPAVAPLRAIEFMEKYNPKPRDALHLDIMEHFRVSEIVSDDSDFDKIKGIKRIKLN